MSHLYFRDNSVSGSWTINKYVNYPFQVYKPWATLSPHKSFSLAVSDSSLFKWDNNTFLPQRGVLKIKQLVICFEDELPCFHDSFAPSLAQLLQQLNI